MAAQADHWIVMVVTGLGLLALTITAPVDPSLTTRWMAFADVAISALSALTRIALAVAAIRQSRQHVLRNALIRQAAYVSLGGRVRVRGYYRSSGSFQRRRSDNQ
jgi:hypothetical protein